MIRPFGLMAKANWIFLSLVLAMGLTIAFVMEAVLSARISDAVTEEMKVRTDAVTARIDEQRQDLLADARLISNSPGMDALRRARDNGGVDPVTGLSSEVWSEQMDEMLAALEQSHSSYVSLQTLPSARLRSSAADNNASESSLDSVVSEAVEDRDARWGSGRIRAPYVGLHQSRSGEWLAVALIDAAQPDQERMPLTIVLIRNLSSTLEQLSAFAVTSTRMEFSWNDQPIALANAAQRLEGSVPADVLGRSVMEWSNGSLVATSWATRSEGALGQSFLTGLAVVAGVLLIGLMVASWFIRKLTSPVVEMTRAVESFSNGGAVTELDTSGWGELGQLAEAMNRCMAKFVEQSSALNLSHQALQRRETYLRTVLETAPVGIVHVRADGQMQDTNKLAEQLLNISYANDRTRFLDIVYEVSGQKYADVSRMNDEVICLADDQRVDVGVAGHLTDDGPAYVVVMTDISEWSAAEQRAKQNEAFLDAILENLPLMLFIKDAETLEFVRVNRHCEELLGLSRLDLVGKSDRDFFEAEEAEAFMEADRCVLSSGEVLDIPEEAITTRRGETRYLHTRKMPLHDDDGAPRYLLGISEDITEFRDRFHLQIRNEALLGAVFENAPFAILLQDADDLTYLRANSAAEEILDLTRDAIVGHLPADVIPVEQERALREFCASDALYSEEEIRIAEDAQPRILDVHCVKIVDEDQQVTHLLTIIDDVTERRLAHQQMERGKAEAERANHAKSAFLAAMSHEIRTPMNGVLGTLDLLSRSSLSTAQTKLSTIARDSAHQLLRVIDDVLDFSKIESEKVSIESESFHLDQTLESVVENLWQQAQKNNVRISCSIDPSTPTTVTGDSVRVRQVFYNLIGNAIKFRDADKPASYVWIGCERKLDRDESGRMQIRFWVEDNGIGIREDRVESVFQAFEQEEVSTTRRFGGSGLGLSISKRLVELMGGKIQVSSESGKGTRFDVILPFDEAEGPPRRYTLEGISAFLDIDFGVSDQVYRYLAAEQVVVQSVSALDLEEHADADTVVITDDREGFQNRIEKIAANHPACRFVVLARNTSCDDVDRALAVCVQARPLGRSSLIEGVAVAAGRQSPYDRLAPAPVVNLEERRFVSVNKEEAAGRLILVAEDNEANQAVIEQQLSSLGYACRIAENGRAALALLEQHSFGCILADCHMPVMDGFSLTKGIRGLSSPYAASVPVIAFTANALKGEAERCREAGMDDFLSKPVSLEDLAQKLASWIDELRGAQFDASALTAVVGDDPQVQKRVATRFLDTASGTDREILAALDRPEELRRLAHRYKSSARSVGLLRLGDACEALEAAANGDNASKTIQSLARRVIRLSVSGATELRAQFASHTELDEPQRGAR